MGDIKVLEYSVGKGKGRGWSVTFTSPMSVIIDRYHGPYIGFKVTVKDKERWVVFEIDSKTVKINGTEKEYIYTADFLGHNPNTAIELETVDFEWIDDEEVISQARTQACWT